MTSSETRIDPARVLRCIEEARPLADGDVDPEAGAAFDTLAERHVPALLAEVERLRAAITEVLVMWDDCGLAREPSSVDRPQLLRRHRRRPRVTGLNSYGDIGVARGSRYKARARYRDRTGAYSYVARFGQTKREAEQRLKAALDGLTRSGGGITSAATLTELAARWLAEDRADRPWSTGTRQHYEYATRRYVIPQLGELRIREASTSVCDAALRRVTAEHGPAAAKTTRAVLNGMFNLAARHDLLPVNPMRETRAVGARSKQARALTAGEVERVTDGLRSDPDGGRLRPAGFGRLHVGDGLPDR
jgi:hypothetical protein